jgi:hypothetical protein
MVTPDRSICVPVREKHLEILLGPSALLTIGSNPDGLSLVESLT